jgi:type IV pilus assembly protein PilA
MHVRRSGGFTFIELMIVIGIIGILATVVLSNITSARAKAHQAKTEASLRSAQTTATYCMDSGNDLNMPDIANLICAGQRNWPAPVGSGWVYGDAGSCGFDGDVSDKNFLYCATNGTTVITCTDMGCSTS